MGKPVMMRAEPGKEPEVLPFPEGTTSPVWSPDGKTVAFLVAVAGGRSRNLWTAAADGTGAREITTKLWVREFTWSPDSTKIACVVGRTVGTTLWIADPVSKDIRLLYNGFCSAPAFSPDGHTLALAAPILRGEHKIVLIDAETGSEKLRIATKGFDGKSLSWSPDGRTLVFASGDPDSAIYSVGRDGKNLRRLTQKGMYAFGPSFSPSGDRILFSGVTAKSYGPDLYTMKPDGSDLKQLTHTVPSQWQPVWSPDGRRIAYLTDEGNAGKVMVRPLESTKAKAIFQFDPGTPARLRWSPDGKHLLFAQGGSVYRLRPDAPNTNAKPALKVSGHADPCPGEDGEIFFVNWKSGKGVLARLDPGETDPKQLTSGGEKEKELPTEEGFASSGPHEGILVPASGSDTRPRQKVKAHVPDLYPSLSPDGKTIAFVRDEQVWLVSPAGRNLRQVTNLEPPQGGRRILTWPSWSPGSSRLVFEGHVEQEDLLITEIWVVDLPDGQPRRVWTEKAESEYALLYAEQSWNPPVFTPDGKGILFTSSALADSRPSILDLADEKVRVLVDEPAVFPALSPDGKRLAYTSLAGDRETVKVVEIAGRLTGNLQKG